MYLYSSELTSYHGILQICILGFYALHAVSRGVPNVWCRISFHASKQAKHSMYSSTLVRFD
jgi:hypothetical protein